MAHDFHIGQQVVCILDFGPEIASRGHGENYPKKGCVYTIRDFSPNNKKVGGICVYLEEIVNEPRQYFFNGELIHGEANFALYAFKPVRKTDISIFTEMLNPVNKQVDIDA